MDLRDQEVAATVQDLEVRHMELEAQRKQLEQVTNNDLSFSVMLHLFLGSLC